MTGSLSDHNVWLMPPVQFYSESVLKRNTANMYLVKENHKTYVNDVSRHYIPIKQSAENDILQRVTPTGCCTIRFAVCPFPLNLRPYMIKRRVRNEVKHNH